MKARHVIALTLLLCGSFAVAQDPKVRASMSSTDAIYVGQRTTLVVELLVPGFFAGAASFHMPDPQGLILIPPVGSPVVSSETIDGISFTVQRHEIAVLAARAGECTIPPVPVRIQFKRMPLDKDPVTATVTTPVVRFTATMPPGAEKLGHIISARNLQVTESWNPEPGKTSAKAGDAFTRTITCTAPDVPGMMFPPFPAGVISGLGIYPKEPQVLDKSDRGDLTGQRRDVITYACEHAGHFVIPAAKLTWFDLEAKELRTIDFPERAFDVAPNPALAAPGVSESTTTRGWIRPVVVGALVLFAAFLCRGALRRAVSDLVAPLRPVHLQPLNPYPKPPS